MDGSSFSTSESSGSLQGSSGSSSAQPKTLLFACNICSRTPPANPVITACGHSFCWQPCMSQFLRGQAKPCPVCTTILCSDINVVPIHTNKNRSSLMLYLPTTDRRVITQVERSEDNLVRMRTNTVLVPGRQALSPIPEESESQLAEETRDVNVFVEEHIHQQIEGLQRRVCRAKRRVPLGLRNSRTIGRRNQ